MHVWPHVDGMSVESMHPDLRTKRDVEGCGMRKSGVCKIRGVRCQSGNIFYLPTEAYVLSRSRKTRPMTTETGLIAVSLRFSRVSRQRLLPLVKRINRAVPDSLFA